MHQRGDEDGLARARQPGHAEPDRRVEQALAELPKRPRREPGLVGQVGNKGYGGKWRPAAVGPIHGDDVGSGQESSHVMAKIWAAACGRKMAQPLK
jgi:hypothetical protein